MNEILYLEFDGLPPTINSMYRSSGNHRYKKKVIADWQEDISRLMDEAYRKNHLPHYKNCENAIVSYRPPYIGKVAVDIEFIVSDRRKWDIDNRLKALLDCLELAEVIENDYQIDSISVCRHRGSKNTTQLRLYEFNNPCLDDI